MLTEQNVSKQIVFLVFEKSKDDLYSIKFLFLITNYSTEKEENFKTRLNVVFWTKSKTL